MSIDNDMLKIMKRIKEKRLELGLSFQELSRKTGISSSTLQRYETGYISNVPLSKLKPLSKALGVTPIYLMGWEDEKTEKAPELLEDEKEILNIYNQLDEGDKGELRGIGKGMLRAEKYKSYKSKLQA